MHAIFCLLKHDTLRTIHHIVSYFQTPLGGQVVHEPGGLGCRVQEVFVDLKFRKRLHASDGIFLLAHAGPNVSIDDVGRLYRCRSGMHLLDAMVRIALAESV